MEEIMLQGHFKPSAWIISLCINTNIQENENVLPRFKEYLVKERLQNCGEGGAWWFRSQCFYLENLVVMKNENISFSILPPTCLFLSLQQVNKL